MRVAARVALLAVMGTVSHMLDHWRPNSDLIYLFWLGKWLDVESVVSQYALSITSGSFPDPSSTLFQLWNGIRFVAAVLLLFGVAMNLRSGKWLRPYQLLLLGSMALWVLTLAYLAVCAVLPIAFGVIVAVGTFSVMYYEDPVEKEQRLTRESERLAEEQAREAEITATNPNPFSLKFLLTVLDTPPYLYLEHVTDSASPNVQWALTDSAAGAGAAAAVRQYQAQLR